jgi:NTE family protein
MNICSIKVCIGITVAIACLPLNAPAREVPPSEPAERPRIGLVLGGGGARGAAHIGVLRELERLQIPIDVIVGTSMGAIVGGLYASGKSVRELEEIIASLDWIESFQDVSERSDLTFRRKQDDQQFPIKFKLGLRDGRLQLPKGLIQGQNLGLILRELTLSTFGTTDFDELPIPFRAVASDIETGEEYVMSRGDLAHALRASMSAPGLFAPVNFDGHLLVDGGITGNVPVTAMRAMDVDIIIAVDVEFPLYSPDQLNTVLDISAQMLTILIQKETRRELATLGPQDFLIRPELGQFGSANFAEITEAVEPGAVATAELENRLKQHSLSDDAYRQHLANRSVTPVLPETIDFVRVANDGRLSSRILESRLSSVPGDPVSAKHFARDAEALYGLDFYERVGYRLVTEDDQTGVEFEAMSKSWGPNFLQFGISLEDDFDGSTAFNLSARATRTGINSLGAEWRSDVQIGTNPLLHSEFYQPLSFDARYFIAPHIDMEQRNFNAFIDESNVARYRVSDLHGGVDVGRELGRWGEARFGILRGRGSAVVKVGDPDFPRIEYDTGGLFARLGIDTLDNAQFPQRGILADVEWFASRAGIGADTDFESLETNLNFVRTYGRNTFQVGGSYKTTIKNDVLIQNFFPLGGFLRLSGLARGEISGPHAGVARIVYYRRIGETGGGLFDVPLYIGASLEQGAVWQTREEISFNSLLTNGSIFAGMDTYFGPLFLAAGFAEGGKSNFYLSLGSRPR